MWFRSSRPSKKCSTSRMRQYGPPLQVEMLEDRRLLSAASITGTAFEDITGNGVTADDLPVVGRTVNLYKDNGDGRFDARTDALLAQQVTDRHGRYAFRVLAAGDYFVQQQVPADWAQTAPAAHVHDVIITPSQVSLEPRESNDTLATAIATGLRSAARGTYRARGEIGDKNKALDVDMFQVQANAGDMVRIDIDADAFNSGLDSVLRVFDAAGAQVAAIDDTPGGSADPGLEFVAKTTGTYYVAISGFANVQYNPFVERSGNPAFSFNTGAYTIEIEVGPRPGAQPIAVRLAANESRTGVDIASSRLGSIQGQMYEDIDGDGIQDAGERCQDGQFIALMHQGAIVNFTTTRSIDLNRDGAINPATESGWYSFEELTPGIYFTRGLASFGVGAPGWRQTSPSFQRPAIVGEVPSGPGTNPGIPGLLPDLTVELSHGLGDWFIVNNVLHYGQATPNIGLGHMELRAGPDQGNGTQIVYQRIYHNTALTSYTDYQVGTFTFHPEHNHIHFNSYAQFSVRQALPDGADANDLPDVGAVVAGGQKTSFCLLDTDPFDLTLPNAAQQPSGFGCGEVQRISVGWMDVYDPLTQGQQIDVSGLAPGQYWLEGVVDPTNVLFESNETNNVGRVLITVGFGAPNAPAGQHSLLLRSGEIVSDKDFGNFQLVNISGQVFDDRNRDGQLNSNEHSLSGWTVFIDVNGDGVLNNPEGNGIPSALAKEPWAITDNQGRFLFANVGPGTHRIRQVLPAGWIQTSPNPTPIEARSGQDVSGVVIGNVQGSSLLAPALGAGPAAALTGAEVDSAMAEAIRRWQVAGVDATALFGMDVRIADLGGTTLGMASGDTIWLDANAAGWGWFVDPTPSDDAEFYLTGDQGEADRMDLLTVLMHEMGHILGLEHDEEGIMADSLLAGTRPHARRQFDVPALASDALIEPFDDDKQAPWLGGTLVPGVWK